MNIYLILLLLVATHGIERIIDIFADTVARMLEKKYKYNTVKDVVFFVTVASLLAIVTFMN